MRHAAEAVQEAVCKADERLRAAVNPPQLLHITLAVTRLLEDAHVTAAIDILRTLAPRLHALVPPQHPIVISGVGDFRDRVLYAAVEPHAGLVRFVDELRAALLAAGLPAGELEEYVAHVTLFKLPRALTRTMGAIPRGVWWGMRALSFGEQPAATAALCWMRPPGDQCAGDDFYQRLAQCHLGRMMVEQREALDEVAAMAPAASTPTPAPAASI